MFKTRFLCPAVPEKAIRNLTRLYPNFFASQASDTFDNEGSRYDEDDGASAAGELHSNTNKNTQKKSKFRSMLARGGKSGSAAAAALKQKLARGTPQNPSSSIPDNPRNLGRRFGRGEKRRSKRHPVQHADSQDDESSDSSEGSEDRRSGDDVTADSTEDSEHETGPRDSFEFANNSADNLDDHGSTTTSNEHYGERRMTNPRASNTGGVVPRGKLSRMSSKKVVLADRLRKLKPTARTLRFSNRNNIDATGSRTPAADMGRSPTSSPFSISDSDSSADELENDRDRGEESSFGGATIGEKTAVEDGHASLLSLDKRDRRAVTRVGEDSTGTAKAAPGPSSGQGGTRLLRRWLGPQPSRQGARDRLDRDAVEDRGAVAPMTGAGAPAVGIMEDLLSKWFGGVLGSNWPGFGLAPRPVFADKEVSDGWERDKDGGGETISRYSCCRKSPLMFN